MTSLVAALASAGFVAACGSGSGYTEDTYAVPSGHLNRAVVIGSGAIGPDRWAIRASVNAEGQLCMDVTWTPAGAPPDGGCGFGSNTVNDGGRGTEPINTSRDGNGDVLTYGPTPAGAVRARLTLPKIDTQCGPSAMPPTDVAITHHMPSWYAVNGRGWFAVHTPQATGDCIFDVTFTDRNGHTVHQPNDY